MSLLLLCSEPLLVKCSIVFALQISKFDTHRLINLFTYFLHIQRTPKLQKLGVYFKTFIMCYRAAKGLSFTIPYVA